MGTFRSLNVLGIPRWHLLELLFGPLDELNGVFAEAC